MDAERKLSLFVHGQSLTIMRSIEMREKSHIQKFHKITVTCTEDPLHGNPPPHETKSRIEEEFFKDSKFPHKSPEGSHAEAKAKLDGKKKKGKN